MFRISRDLVIRQTQLLDSFASVSDKLSGVTAMLWLPGLRHRFNNAPRSIGGVRPLCVTLEVTDSGGLALSGAIAFPKKNALRFDPIFKYEFTQPMREHSVGPVLSFKNEVIANRALALLASLVRFGHRIARTGRVDTVVPVFPRYLVPFNVGEEVYDPAKLAELSVGIPVDLVPAYQKRLCADLTDSTSLMHTTLVDSAIVPDYIVHGAISAGLGYENYAPVLGMTYWNPINRIREQANPANAILVAHGITNLDAVTKEQLDRLEADFRVAVILGQYLTTDEIYNALVNPERPVKLSVPAKNIPNQELVDAMRKISGTDTRISRDATDEDLLRAAHRAGPLLLAKLSRTQIVDTAALNDVPAPYSGSVLAPIDWAPQYRRNEVVLT